MAVVVGAYASTSRDRSGIWKPNKCLLKKRTRTDLGSCDPNLLYLDPADHAWFCGTPGGFGAAGFPSDQSGPPATSVGAVEVEREDRRAGAIAQRTNGGKPILLARGSQVRRACQPPQRGWNRLADVR